MHSLTFFVSFCIMATAPHQLRLKELPDSLLSTGRYSITAKELKNLVPSTYVYRGMEQLKKAGKVFSPAKGFYLVVPPEYRSWGVVPAEWFIDALMEYQGVRYYVALLSAAAMHGAAHQQPQVFQVITSKQVRNRDVGRIRLRFFTSRYVDSTPTVKLPVHTGYVRVSTREGTVFDLVAHPQTSVGLSNVATIVKQLGQLDGKVLARIGAARPRADSRRVGWLVERFSPDADLGSLRKIAQPEIGEPVALDSRGLRKGERDKRWGVLINASIEPDI